MDKAGHIFIGGALGTILVLLAHYFLDWFEFNIINIILIIGIIYIYSLISDVDMKNSTITWTFIPVGIVALISGYVLNNNLFLLFGIGLITVTFLAAQFLPHRGFTHSILFGIAVSLPWIYFSWHYSLLAFICFYSHLIADEEYFKLV
jgi:hypothetical protein